MWTRKFQNVGQMDESECKLGKIKIWEVKTCIEVKHFKVIICFCPYGKLTLGYGYVEFGS